MIWIRRFLAVLIGVVLLLVLVAATALRTFDRATDPKFVKAELVKVDAYGFLYDDLLDSAADEVVGDRLGALPGGLAEFTFADPEQAKAAIIGAIKETFPPEYTQEQVEGALDELLPYLRGESQSFAVRPELDDRARAAVPAITKAIDELDLATQVIDRAVGPNLEQALQQFSLGGAKINVTPQRVREIAHRIAPEEWVNQQIGNALTEIVAWLTSDQDSFTIRVQLADRVPAARQEIETLLREAEFTDFLFDSVVKPRLQQAIGSVAALSHGINITDAEMTAALEKAAPREWVDQQLSGIIDVLAAYIAGSSDRLSFAVPLADRREATIAGLSGLAETKLRQVASSLRACGSAGDAATAASQIASLRLPSCTPPGVDPKAIVEALVPRLKTDLDRIVGGNFPQTISFDRALLEQQLGKDSFAAIDQARELIGGGLTWTDQDILRSLGNDGRSLNSEDLRKVFNHDYAFTEADLLSNLSDGDLQQFQSGRSTMRTVLSLGWLTFLLPILLAAIIGVLGGRRWPSRLAWGAGSLFVTGVIVWAALSIAYGRIQPQVHEALVESFADEPNEDVRRLALAVVEKVEVIVDDIAAGATGYPRTWAIIGIIGVAGSVGWMYYARTAEARAPRRREAIATAGGGSAPAGSSGSPQATLSDGSSGSTGGGQPPQSRS
ncbi:MAG: hypothetical protein HY678_06675 [Chloroflexi bacterium]|nr:hypothetical protein [Chloroflexota bacterium]